MTNLLGCHLLIRIPRSTQIGKELIPLVDDHNDAIRIHGSTWFAKFGTSPSSRSIQALRSQIGVDALLILASKSGGNFVGFGSSISAIHQGVATDAMLKMLPKFYMATNLTARRCWFQISSLFKEVDLAAYRLRANKRSLLEVMRKTTTPMMLVENNVLEQKFSV